MQRDLLKARIAKLPHLPAIAPTHSLGVNEDEDEEEEALDSFPELGAVKTPRRRIPPGADYSPLSAAGYFSTALEVDVPISSVYRSLSAPLSPSASSSTAPRSGIAQFRVYSSPPAPAVEANGAVDGNGVVFVCVHGAGYSGLSWACLAKELEERGEGKVGILAYDARGHGKTTLPSPGEGEGETVDMNLEEQSKDLQALLRALYPRREESPSLVLVGHSMGGAVVADAANSIQDSIADVLGVVVIDVVEGTAIEALPGMSALIASHPKTFSSPEDAIAWHLESRTINNVASARISVPPLIKPSSKPGGGVSGEDEFVWRVRLEETEPYWRGWFTGLSQKFLSCRAAKLLLLAGTDRLDRELLIGQMQGKYQLEVDQLVGHCVHEDAPGRTAETLLSFLERNDRTDADRKLKELLARKAQAQASGGLV